MTDKINLGIIGTNFAANVHLPAFQQTRRCNIAAIAARDFTKTKTIANQHNIPTAYQTWQELINDPNIDAIAIAVPPYIQEEIILAAIPNKKAIFAEKPLATNLQTAKKIADLAAQYNIPNIINFTFAGSEPFIKLKQLIQTKINPNNNPLRYININWQIETITSQTKNFEHWKTQDNAGGGVLFNFASHVLFYLEWLFAPEAINLQSIVAKQANVINNHNQNNTNNSPSQDIHHSPPNNHNLLKIWGELTNGTPINILVSTAAFMGSGHTIEIYTENNTVILHRNNQTKATFAGFNLKIASRDNAKNHTSYNNWDNIYTSDTDSRIATTNHLAAKFINWLDGGAIQTPNFRDGYRVNTILEKIYSKHDM
jgi:predicted dehydrogenase